MEKLLFLLLYALHSTHTSASFLPTARYVNGTQISYANSSNETSTPVGSTGFLILPTRIPVSLQASTDLLSEKNPNTPSPVTPARFSSWTSATESTRKWDKQPAFNVSASSQGSNAAQEWESNVIANSTDGLIGPLQSSGISLNNGNSWRRPPRLWAPPMWNVANNDPSTSNLSIAPTPAYVTSASMVSATPFRFWNLTRNWNYTSTTHHAMSTGSNWGVTNNDIPLPIVTAISHRVTTLLSPAVGINSMPLTNSSGNRNASQIVQGTFFTPAQHISQTNLINPQQPVTDPVSSQTHGLSIVSGSGWTWSGGAQSNPKIAVAHETQSNLDPANEFGAGLGAPLGQLGQWSPLSGTTVMSPSRVIDHTNTIQDQLQPGSPTSAQAHAQISAQEAWAHGMQTELNPPERTTQVPLSTDTAQSRDPGRHLLEWDHESQTRLEIPPQTSKAVVSPQDTPGVGSGQGGSPGPGLGEIGFGHTTHTRLEDPERTTNAAVSHNDTPGGNHRQGGSLGGLGNIGQWRDPHSTQPAQPGRTTEPSIVANPTGNDLPKQSTEPENVANPAQSHQPATPADSNSGAGSGPISPFNIGFIPSPAKPPQTASGADSDRSSQGAGQAGSASGQQGGSQGSDTPGSASGQIPQQPNTPGQEQNGGQTSGSGLNTGQPNDISGAGANPNPAQNTGQTGNSSPGQSDSQGAGSVQNTEQPGADNQGPSSQNIQQPSGSDGGTNVPQNTGSTQSTQQTSGSAQGSGAGQENGSSQSAEQPESANAGSNVGPGQASGSGSSPILGTNGAASNDPVSDTPTDSSDPQQIPSPGSPNMQTPATGPISTDLPDSGSGQSQAANPKPVLNSPGQGQPISTPNLDSGDSVGPGLNGFAQNVVVDGNTVVANGASVTVSGQPVAVSSGIIQVGNERGTLPGAAQQPASSPQPVVAGGLTFTPVQPSTPEATQPVLEAEGQTLTDGGPAVQISGQDVRISSGMLLVATSAIPIPRPQAQSDALSPVVVGGLTFSPIPEPLEPATAPPVVVAGQTLQNSNGVLHIGSQTVKPGASPIDLAGTPVSLGSSNALVIGDRTTTFSLAAPSQGAPIATIADTHVQPIGSDVQIGSSVLTHGDVATIANTPVSLGSSNNLVIGTNTINFSPPPTAPLESPTPVPVATLASQPILALPSGSGVVIGSTTLTPGASATISGTPISLGNSNELILGSSTLTFTPPTTAKPAAIITIASAPITELPLAIHQRQPNPRPRQLASYPLRHNLLPRPLRIRTRRQRHHHIPLLSLFPFCLPISDTLAVSHGSNIANRRRPRTDHRHCTHKSRIPRPHRWREHDATVSDERRRSDYGWMHGAERGAKWTGRWWGL